MWAKIAELWRDSVIMQSLLAILVVGTLAYLTAVGRSVDEQWWALVGLIIGYYFGSDKVVALRRVLGSSAHKQQ